MQLQPRRVLLCEHAWHLVAHDNREDSTNLYRLSPFESVKLLDTPTTVDPDFSLRNLLGNAWSVSRGEQDYRVEVLFHREAAALVDDCRWHHTQEIEKRVDGSLVFRATVSGLDEIKHWILGLGAPGDGPQAE